ncbi:MAG: MarR family winged helix-turn-helix transcriptional regulator [Marinicella sp.]
MSYFENLGNTFMSHFARRLADLINEQGAEVLEQLELTTPVTSISTMQYIYQNSEITATDLAQALQVTHQMATQRINKLIQLKLLKRVANTENQKSKQIKLSPLGEIEINSLQPFINKMQLIFTQLEAETGIKLTQALFKAETSLRNKPLKDRFFKN